jgi:hypothetical protein
MSGNMSKPTRNPARKNGAMMVLLGANPSTQMSKSFGRQDNVRRRIPFNPEARALFSP